METLSEAVARLESDGFRDSFRPEAGRLWAFAARCFFSPEDLVIEETVRFEGESDPGDEAILLALRSRSGEVLGTFASSYGANADPESAEIVRRLGQGRG